MHLEITIPSPNSPWISRYRDFPVFDQNLPKIRPKSHQKSDPTGSEIWVSFHNFDNFFRNVKKSWHGGCIYFSVSSKASGHESRTLEESYVYVFFYPASNTSTNLGSWTHCKSGSGYTGRLGHAYARPSRTAETKCAFGAKKCSLKNNGPVQRGGMVRLG